MPRKYVLHTALFLCLAFAFRLTFNNLGVLATSKTTDKSHLITYFSSLTDKSNPFEVSDNSNKINSLGELFEEDSDDKFKVGTNLSRQILYTFVKDLNFNSHLETKNYKNFCPLTANDRYLFINVFRI
ncbi:MAG: hypothetical protein H7321_05695 [Bacteroidia bacterium]|nr:hypothetical protein [Bacteroidia bacterium]